MIGDDDDLDLNEDQINEGDEEGHDEEEPAGTEAGDEAGDETRSGESEGDEAAGSQALLTPSKPLSRASRAVMQAKAEAKAAREKADAIERELASLRAQRQQQTQQVSERERQERLALMTSEERMEFHLQELRQQQEQFQRQTLAQQQDSQDRATYLAKAAADPRYKKYEAEVEQTLQDTRARGFSFTREFVLAMLLGHKVLAGDKGVTAAAKKAGAARLNSQRTNPPGASSDQGGRTRKEKSLRERLEGVTF